MFKQPFFFDERTQTAFLLQGNKPEDVKLMSAPVSDDGNVLWTHQEEVDQHADGFTEKVWDLLVERIN